MIKYADIANLQEDQRIALIGEQAMKGQRVGFVVEDDEKADRYVAKLMARFSVEEVRREADTPVAGVVMVIVVKKKESEDNERVS